MPRCWTRHRKITCMRPHPSSGGARASAVSLGLQVSAQVRLCLGCWRLCPPARQRRRGGAARAAAPSRATRCSRKALSGGTTCRRRPDALPDSPAAAAALLPVAAASLPLQLGASCPRRLPPALSHARGSNARLFAWQASCRYTYTPTVSLRRAQGCHSGLSALRHRSCAV